MSNDLEYIIVFGPIRSGKTLIGRALNMHPQISVQQEPFFFFFKLCRNIFHRDILQDRFDPEQPIETDFCKRLEVKRRFAQHFSVLKFSDSDIKELKKWTIWQQETAGNERAPKIINLIDRIKQGKAVKVLRDLTDILAQAYPKEDLKFIGFTEAWCDNFISPLLSLNDMKFKCIHIIRDPRAIIASRNVGINLKKYGGKYPLLFLIRHWRKSIAYSIMNKGNPNYFVLRYEDLVASPKEWFQKICTHLNMPFSDNLMHPESYIDGAVKPWKQNTNYEQGKGFSKDSIARWRERLSKEEIGIIDYLCKEEMAYCGYKPVQNKYGLKQLTLFKEDEKEIIDWLKKYNLTINDHDISLEIVRDYMFSAEELLAEKIIDYFFISATVFETLVVNKNLFSI